MQNKDKNPPILLEILCCLLPCLRSYQSPSVRLSHNVCQSMVSSGGWGGVRVVYIEPWCLGDQICCGHGAECYPTSAHCYVAGQEAWSVHSRYASGHNITTLDVLCITRAEATSKLSGFVLLLHLFLFV